MRLTVMAGALMLAALPARADVDAVLDRHILPGLAGFAEAAGALADTAAADCRAPALRPGLDAAFDAWLPVGDLRIGPSETGALSIAFWPDPRGFTQRTLARLVADEDPVAGDAVAYAEVSIAARGLFALEMLIHDPAFAGYGADSYTCRLAATVAPRITPVTAIWLAKRSLAWRAVTWPISWPITPASSASSSASASRPRLT